MAGRGKSDKAHAVRKGAVMRIVDAVTVVVTLAVAVVLLMSYLAPYVNPNTTVVFAFFGLASPFLFLVNMALFLYWIVRWKIYLFIPAVVMLLGISNVSMFFNPVLSKHYEQTAGSSAIKIISYNVRGFFGFDQEGKTVSYFRDIAGYLNHSKADIIAIQEFESNYRSPQKRFDSIMTAYPFKSVYYKGNGAPKNGVGLAVYSRYPIIRSEYIPFSDSNNASMWVDVVMNGKDTVRLFNNHLQSMSLNQAEKDMFNYDVLAEGGGDSEKFKDVLRKVKRGFRMRAVQADSVALLIADTPYTKIVCGDFNDTPMSYAYHKMRGEMKDSFKEKGRGMIYTYNGIFSVFRIDYIFHSDDLKTLSYESVDINWSDHNPVEVVVEFCREPKDKHRKG